MAFLKSGPDAVLRTFSSLQRGALVASLFQAVVVALRRQFSPARGAAAAGKPRELTLASADPARRAADRQNLLATAGLGVMRRGVRVVREIGRQRAGPSRAGIFQVQRQSDAGSTACATGYRFTSSRPARWGGGDPRLVVDRA